MEDYLMTPQLRFPEFTDEWQVKKLGDIAVFFDGKRVPIESAQRQTMSGEYPYYGASGIIDYVNDYIFDGEYVLLAEDGANIIMRSSPVAFIAKGKFWLNNHAHIMKAHGSNVFLATYLEMLRYDNYNTGTTQPKLNAAVVKKIKVATPSKPEQEKIADFLTAVDERIGVGEKKLELLETYKRGVMQKIFNQQVRFKGENGKPYPDWEENILGDLCDKAKSGGTPTATNRKYYDDGEIPFLAISDITEQGKFLTKTSKFITEDGLKNSASWIVPNNSIIYSMYASVGLPAINKIPLATSQAVINLIPNNKTTIEFLYYFLLNYKRFVHRFVETGTQGNLNAQTVKNIPVALPIKEEQQKIADFLTTLDEKITAEKSKLTAARQFKKALLQRMFV